MSKTYCPYPFIGASLQADGVVLPCGQYMNMTPFKKVISIQDTRTNGHMAVMRNTMLNGNVDSGCQCHAEEDAGIKSMRQQAIDQFGYNEFGPLKTVEIFFDNVCNLKCRSCASPYSHLLYEEEKELYGFSLADKKYLKNTLHKEIDVTALTEIKIYGGEPLISQDCEEFFKRLLQESVIENIEIFLSTNATSKPMPNTLEAFKRCKKLHINLSIDGYGKLNSFIRHGANWEAIVENMKFFQNLSNERPQHTVIAVHSAVSVYNINLLDQLDNFVAEHFPNFRHSKQVVQFPIWLNIQHLPSEYKQKIKIKDPAIETYLKIEAEDYFSHFINFHNKLNHLRNEEFENLNPLLSEYINSCNVTVDSLDFFKVHMLKLIN
jgi:MoaA/NifB/PqqE/SkfB family radical SAM enzyme